MRAVSKSNCCLFVNQIKNTVVFRERSIADDISTTSPVIVRQILKYISSCICINILLYATLLLIVTMQKFADGWQLQK